MRAARESEHSSMVLDLIIQVPQMSQCWTFYMMVTEGLRLEGISGGLLVQPPAAISTP